MSRHNTTMCTICALYMFYKPLHIKDIVTIFEMAFLKNRVWFVMVQLFQLFPGFPYGITAINVQM